MEELSTGLRNFLAAGGSMREAFKDMVMRILSGTAPATADAAETGILLMIVSAAGVAVATTDFSKPEVRRITIPGTTAGIYGVIITIDGTTYTALFNTATDVEGGSTIDTIAAGLARKINDACPTVFAIAQGSTGYIYVQSKIPGITMTIADAAGGVGYVVITTPNSEIQAYSAKATVRFGAATAGVISKDSQVWSGTVLVSGIAGYFRFVRPGDATTLSYTDIRGQGDISTSGLELDMDNPTVVQGDAHTVDSYAISVPAA